MTIRKRAANALSDGYSSSAIPTTT